MRRFYLLLFAVALGEIAYSQNSVSPQRHGRPLREDLPVIRESAVATASNTSLHSTSASLDSFFTSYMATYHIPGVAACIVKNKRIAWQGYYGLANISQNVPVTDSTMFMLASISKTVTATALMQLYEAGRFRLDDSVNGHLPFSVRNPNHPEIPITFKMLLTHTSSMQDNWNVLSNVYVIGDHSLPLGTFLQMYLTPGGQYYSQSQNFYTYAPGAAWNYCNVGAALCGYLVETISGIPFDQYCRDSIFVPLQMTGTSWFLKDLNRTLIAHPYTYSNGGYVDAGLFGYPDYPDGQLRTTATSLARFLMANITGGTLGGSRILDSATIHIMRTAYVTGSLEGWVDNQQGLIWMATTDINGKTLWGHIGGDTGVETAMFLSQSDSTGVVMLTNMFFGYSEWELGVRRLMSAADTLTVGVEETPYAIPERILLHQNYPNPFNPSTTIRYGLPSRSLVTLTVFNTLGQMVATLVEGEMEAGYHEAVFDASSLASGVYLYRLQAGDVIQTKRLVLVR